MLTGMFTNKPATGKEKLKEKIDKFNNNICFIWHKKKGEYILC